MASAWWRVGQFLIKVNTQWFCSLLLPQEMWKHKSLQNSYANINGNFIYNSSKLETTQMSKSRISNVSMYIHTENNCCTVERSAPTDTHKMSWSQKQRVRWERAFTGWVQWQDDMVLEQVELTDGDGSQPSVCPGPGRSGTRIRLQRTEEHFWGDLGGCGGHKWR